MHWCNITEHERETQPTILFYLEVVVDFLFTNPHYNGIGSYRCFRVQGVRKLQNVATGCSVDPLSNPVVINILLVHRKGHVQQDTTRSQFYLQHSSTEEGPDYTQRWLEVSSTVGGYEDLASRGSHNAAVFTQTVNIKLHQQGSYLKFHNVVLWRAKTRDGVMFH